MRLAHSYDTFAEVSRRINLVPRLITAQEWLQDGYDREEVAGLLADLEREVARAIRENEEYDDELEDAA